MIRTCVSISQFCYKTTLSKVRCDPYKFTKWKRRYLLFKYLTCGKRMTDPWRCLYCPHVFLVIVHTATQIDMDTNQT